ncbi:integrase, partial [Shewanella decolorationis S12]
HSFFFFNDTATTEIYTLSLHDALPILGKFAKAETQAASVVKALQKNGAIRSLVTAKNYTDALTRVGRFVKEQRLSLRELTPEMAVNYLNIRGEEVGQKTLDQERHEIGRAHV